VFFVVHEYRLSPCTHKTPNLRLDYLSNTNRTTPLHQNRKRPRPPIIRQKSYKKIGKEVSDWLDQNNLGISRIMGWSVSGLSSDSSDSGRTKMQEKGREGIIKQVEAQHGERERWGVLLDLVAECLALLRTPRAYRRKRSHRATSHSIVRHQFEILLSIQSRRSVAVSGALSHWRRGAQDQVRSPPLLSPLMCRRFSLRSTALTHVDVGATHNIDLRSLTHELHTAAVSATVFAKANSLH
jgi:hypothetical protein